MKTNNNIPLPQSDAHESLLLAGVCDVRGFSTLQAHIDEYLQNEFTPTTRSSDLAKRNIKYMDDTRCRAETVFEETLRESLGKDHEGNYIANSLCYAVKSTGDGFLVVLELVDLRQGVKVEVDGIDYPLIWKDRACSLVHALWNLYKESAFDNPKNGSFGKLTKEFLNEFGMELGFAEEDLQKHGLFLVPGAIAMGTGTISPAKQRLLESDGSRRGDAYGHPINVAFRLCDLAGRFKPGEKKISPAVLIDRRVGRVLAKVAKEKMPTPLGPLDPVSMKGIEETWCYALGGATSVKEEQ